MSVLPGGDYPDRECRTIYLGNPGSDWSWTSVWGNVIRNKRICNMYIKNQLRTARNTVRKQAEELQYTWDLSLNWFRDSMIAEVFGYLLKGRIKHDAAQKPDTFYSLWSDVEQSKIVATFVDHGSKFLFNEFNVSMNNINYIIEERPDHEWHARPAALNISLRSIPSRVRLSSDSFIRFMEEFNSIVPLINDEAADLHKELSKKEITENIFLLSLESFVDDTLSSIDIPYSYELKNDGLVFRFWLRGHTGLRVRIPIEQYASRIKELPELVVNPEKGIIKYGKDFRYERLKK